jgi:hypothetical protein
MLQRDGVMMVEMQVLVLVMMMMILMKSSAMVMMMVTISLLREGISPIDFCLPENFSLSVFSAPQRQWSLSLIPHFCLRFSGTTIYARGDGRSGPGWTHPRVARPGAGPRHLVVWAFAAPFALSFWLLSSSGNICISRYFPRIVDIQKYGVLTVLFSAES